MFEGWSDDEVRAWLRQAATDLGLAAEQQPESEWHEACFAATVALSQEAGRRGLTL